MQMTANKNTKQKTASRVLNSRRISIPALFRVLLLAVTCCLQPLTAQSKAMIMGTVSDDSDGSALPGVNIIIKGTYYGTASDGEGRFFIRDISPGAYDIEFSMIGYTQQLIAGIELTAGETKTLEVKLKTTVLALGQEVTVIGERPIIDADATSSSVSVRSSELEGKIVENVTDIISQQMGVAESDNEIHIRGGRADEGQFIVDGLAIKDPLTGATSNLYINANAIEELEFITGGFNAEYGQAMSGIIDVKLKEGAEDLEGSFKYKTDRITDDGFNMDNIEFSLGGPIFREGRGPLPGTMSYFSSAYLNIADSYLPVANAVYPYKSWMERFSTRGNNDLSLMGKLSWNPSRKQKLSASYNHSVQVNQGYYSGSGFPYPYIHLLDNYPTSTRESQVVNIQWIHTLNPTLFYNLNYGYFYTGNHRAVQNKHWSEYTELLDLDPTHYDVTDELGNIRVSSGDEFWDYGDAPYWYDYYSKNYSVEGDLTWQPSERHKLKSGFLHRYTELQVVDIYKPWVGSSGFGESYDFYKVYPSNGSLYIQDKITFEGMITNIGLRYDYWLIGDYVTRAVDDPEVLTITEAGRELYYQETFSLLGHRAKAHLSPRLGISHPVSDSDVLYFNYGHFSQLPTYNYVYAKLSTVSEATYQLIGNPNLSPKTTVSYEIGLKHKFSRSTAMEFKAYYKDMFDYETSQSITTFNPLVGRYDLTMYISMDYARSRGIEVIWRKMYGKYLSGDLSYSYSIATGKSSTPNDNLLVEAGRLSTKPITENYLRWDEPHRLVANIRLQMNSKNSSGLFGLSALNDWKINWHIEGQSGNRYTPSIATDTLYADDGFIYVYGFSQSDKPYSSIADAYVLVDMKVSKYFDVGSSELAFFIDIENLMDFPVPRRINPYTGDAYDPGEIISESYRSGINPNYDPARYYEPRRISAGISLRF